MSVNNCKWPECSAIVPPGRWGCTKHWTQLAPQYRIALLNNAANEAAVLRITGEVHEWWKKRSVVLAEKAAAKKQAAPAATGKRGRGRPHKDHGAPEKVIEIARQYFGGSIGFDPCSSDFWNERVLADVILTDKGESAPWATRAFVYAPANLELAFWKQVVAHWQSVPDFTAVWFSPVVGLPLLHDVTPPMYSPLEWRTLFPREKVVLAAPNGKEEPVFGYITFIGEGDATLGERLLEGITVARVHSIEAADPQ